MRNIILKTILAGLIVLATGCTSHTSMDSYGISGPSIMVDNESLESQITIGGKISGIGSSKYFLGFWKVGDTHSVEGVWGGGVDYFSKDHAKMEATYNALQKSGADMIIEPRYEITTKKTSFLWTTITAKVTGFKGTIDGFTHYKQDKPSYLEENYGYPPATEPLNIKVD